MRTYARAYSRNLEKRMFLNFLKAFLSFNRMTYLLFRIIWAFLFEYFLYPFLIP